MIFNEITPAYYTAIDSFEQADQIQETISVPEEKDGDFKTGLGPKEIGTGANPFEHPLSGLNARIKHGAGRVEFTFFGAGKGNKERFTPESISSKERKDMRELAEINQIKTSTHASVAVQGLAGMGQNGFDNAQRYQAVKEIKKAVDFAAEATTGGAIVVHTGEWNRPISESWKREGFIGYDEEEKEAQVFVVDQRTGKFVGEISKDRIIYEPEYETNEDGEWIDMDGNVISKDASIKERFNRVPVWNKENRNFKTHRLTWNDLVEKSETWNKTHHEDQITPEIAYMRIQLENQILQAKGSSLYHAQRYEGEKRTRDALKEALAFYEKLEATIPDDEKWRLLTNKLAQYGLAGQFTRPKLGMPSEILKNELTQTSDMMRYTHEASGAADVQASTHMEMYENLVTTKEYGLKKTAETISTAGIHAMHQYEQNKDHLDEPLYVAPENWQTTQFGGHPDELREIIESSRKRMAAKLKNQFGEQKAKELAATHIKATLDVGHMNQWRQHFQKEQGETEDEWHKRFNKWLVNKTKDMAKDGLIGHVHLTDNFGYDDEHLTPGEGNAPIKEFVTEMEKAGLKEFIVEAGSFNPLTALPDTWTYLKSPVYGVSRRQVGAPGGPSHFGNFQHQHFGYNAPPHYIIGAYVPSNEWKLWTETPLE